MWSRVLVSVLLANLVTAEIPNWIRCQSGSGEYTIPDELFCDKYYTCKNDGTVTENQCEDGFGFVPYGGCKLLHRVECGPRKLLQPAQGSGPCRRLNGVFSAPEGCGRFFKCYRGVPENDACPPGQMLDEIRVECRHPTPEEKEACARIWATPAPQKGLLDLPSQQPSVNFELTSAPTELIPDPDAFKCPDRDSYPYGDHSRQPIPGQCKYFMLCISDGTKKVSGCPNGEGFNPKTTICEDIKNIPACNKS